MSIRREDMDGLYRFVKTELVSDKVVTQGVRCRFSSVCFFQKLAFYKSIAGKILSPLFGRFQKLINLPLIRLRNDRQGIEDALSQVFPVFIVVCKECNEDGRRMKIIARSALFFRDNLIFFIG
ncbi:MAG: hypothetical protein U0586_10690 [Candidatus Brocadiaceae bacterium]